MLSRILSTLLAAIFVASSAFAQPDAYKPDPQEVLRLIRADKLDLVLPVIMRKHGIDMWINVTRAGNRDPLEYEFGQTAGYLIFTDRGDKIERAIFGSAPGIPNIDVQGSNDIARAVEGYDFGHNEEVYNELRNFVAERDPKKIAVNYSEWLAVADGISYSQYKKLARIIGPKYSERIVSAEYLITEFRARRTLREVAVQTNTLEIARQNTLKALARIVPGETTIGSCQCDLRIYYSAVSKRTNPPGSRAWIRESDYVVQRGDFFAFSGNAEWMDFGDNSFGVDTKAHGYLLREGETSVPKSLQYAWNQVKKAQGILRENVKVGMTAGESLAAMVAAMEAADYIYTPFTDVNEQDYRDIQAALKGTDKSGFYVDLHAMGNNGGGLITVGPSMAGFRRDRDHLVIQENNILAFEFAVHTNLPERKGYPITINFSNPQVVTSLGVEWIQSANEKIFVIR